MDKQRDIGPELHTDGGELIPWDPCLAEPVKTDQDRCRITAAAAQTRGNGDILAKGDPGAAGSGQPVRIGCKKKMGCTQGYIPPIPGQITVWTVQRNSTGCDLNLKGVTEIKLLHERCQEMIAIIPAPQDLEIQVDFRRRLYPDCC